MEAPENKFTVAGLTKLLLGYPRIVKVDILVMEEQPAVVVKVKLKFWQRVWAALSSDYCDKVKNEVESIVSDTITVGLEYHLIIEL